MAVRDGERYLTASLTSLLSQTFSSFEIIIINDGSTDRTEEVLSKLSKKDKRLKVLHQSQEGLTKCLNRGLLHASGQYIARMDADDIASIHRLEQQVAYMDLNPETVCCGSWAIEIDCNDRPFRLWQLPIRHSDIDAHHINGRGGGIIHPSAILRRETLLSCGGYDDRFRVAQDYDLWLRLAEIGKLENLPTYLLKYRRSLQSITHTRSQLQFKTSAKINSEARKRRGLEEIHIPTPDSTNTLTNRAIALSAVEANFPRTALFYLTKAIRQDGDKLDTLLAFGRLLKSVLRPARKSHFE